MERCLACEAVVSKAPRYKRPRLSALYGRVEFRIVINLAAASIAGRSPPLVGDKRRGILRVPSGDGSPCVENSPGVASIHNTGGIQSYRRR